MDPKSDSLAHFLPNHITTEASSINPYAPPLSQLTDVDTMAKYAGIGRLAFFVACLLIVGLRLCVMSQDQKSATIIMLITWGLLLWPASLRLKNIGRNRAWCLVLPVPVLNLFVIVPCLMYPAGYEDHGKLDTAGKMVKGLFLCLLGLFVLAILAELFLPIMSKQR